MCLLYDGETGHDDRFLRSESVRGRKITADAIVLSIRLLKPACGTPTSVDHTVNVYLCSKSVVKNRMDIHIFGCNFPDLTRSYRSFERSKMIVDDC